MTEMDEVDVEESGEVAATSVRTTLCLDWGCEDFGLHAAIELRNGEATEFVCPHGRPRCPFP
jgi:hypothetical protein